MELPTDSLGFFSLEDPHCLESRTWTWTRKEAGWVAVQRGQTHWSGLRSKQESSGLAWMTVPEMLRTVWKQMSVVNFLGQGSLINSIQAGLGLWHQQMDGLGLLSWWICHCFIWKSDQLRETTYTQCWYSAEWYFCLPWLGYRRRSCKKLIVGHREVGRKVETYRDECNLHLWRDRQQIIHPGRSWMLKRFLGNLEITYPRHDIFQKNEQKRGEREWKGQKDRVRVKEKERRRGQWVHLCQQGGMWDSGDSSKFFVLWEKTIGFCIIGDDIYSRLFTAFV